MKAQDLIDLAARNLRESKLRNSLTTLGIGVGVASLVAMLSLGVGLQELASSRLSRSGLFDIIIVYSTSEMRGMDRGRHEREQIAAGKTRLIDEAARQEMEKLPNVAEVFPNVSFSAEVRIGEKSEFTVVSSVPMSARTNDAFDTMTGRFFSGNEAEEAILRQQFAKLFSDKPESLIGSEVTIRYGVRQPLPPSEDAAPKPADPADAAGGSPGSGEELGGFTVVRKETKLKIVGITETQPFGGPQFLTIGRGGMSLPVGLAEKLNLTAGLSLRDFMRNTISNRTYQGLVVRVSNPSKVKETEDAIDKMGFNTFSLLEATRNLRRFFAVLDSFLGLFGSVALAVASLGIINTLVMSVLERRREIGIMKALGASDRDVKRLFFAEAGTMGFIGGVVGVALGWAIGKAINFGTNIYLQRQELPPERIWSVPWWLVLGAIGFAIFVSLVSGLYPASRAAKLDPVQALRYE